MEVFYILGGIVVAVIAVLGWLFVSLKKVASGSAEVGVVPVADLESLKTPVPATLGTSPVPPIVAGNVVIDEPDARVELLKEEISLASERTAALVADFNVTLGKIKAENEALRADITRLEVVNKRLNDEELAHYKAENEAFKAQLDASKAEAASSLNQPAPEVPFDSALSVQAVEALKEDIETLRSERSVVEERVQWLEEALRSYEEKNSFLQYELAKSRAQALGVERVCDNARRQFEGMAREAHDTEHDNAMLKKQSNVLEQGLADFKRLNSELLKREKLTQFELENNRSQLNDLEDIYRVFRSRLQSAGVDAPLTKS